MAACLALESRVLAQLNSDSAADLVIRDVTVVSAERATPLEHAYVRIRNGRIAEIGTRPVRAAQQIDGAGRYLIPGLIDSHVHLNVPAGMQFDQQLALPELTAVARAQEPRSYLFFGFTTIIDMFGVARRIADWNALDVRPDAYFCGGAPIANGFPMNLAPDAVRFNEEGAYRYFLYDDRQVNRIPDTVDPARHTPEAVVARMAEDGAVCVKAHYEPGNALAGSGLPTPTLPLMRSLVAAAHARDMPIVIHANNREAQAFAVEVEPDVITHTIPDAVSLNRATLDDEVRATLDTGLARGIAFQPTLQPFYAVLALFDESYLQDPWVADTAPAELLAWFATEPGRRFREQVLVGFGGQVPPGFVVTREQSYTRIVRHLAANDAQLVFGSDTPANASYGNLAGLSSRLEIGRLHNAGVTEARLFRALTLDNARMFRLAREIGTVEVGKVANLLLVAANPISTIEAYDTIEMVFIHGRPITRATLSARYAPAP